MRCIAFINLLLLSFSFAFAQQSKTFFESTDTLSIDSNIIDCTSVFIVDAYNNELNPMHYQCIPGSKILLLTVVDFPITVQYTSLALAAHKVYRTRSRSLIQPKGMAKKNPFAFSPHDDIPNPINPLSSSTLSTSGSITRGIISGNNKDLSVNSSLNLQLGGKLSEEIEVQGVISDQNIPIQPEGNTAQLQDFDKVYITVQHPSWKITAGDMQVINEPNPFLIYNKRIKGMALEQPIQQQKGFNKMSYSIARGKYARNTFQGAEGNQGPYKLRGNSNETFIVILSNSERVYLDGVLLQRGENYDYVIDYNVGELTFTSRKIITINSRIYVEFEYSDRNYARSLQLLSTFYEVGNTSFELNYYNEKDNPNRPLLQSLDRNQQLFLQSIGSNIDNAFYPSIIASEYQVDQIFYVKTDTLGFNEVLKYSARDTVNIFRANFTFVGKGNGDYVQDNTLSLNAKVYKWVQPLNGQSQGDYAPVQLLVTPKKFQTLVLGAKHKFNNLNIGLYVANNNKDLNLYDDQSKNTQALKAFVAHQDTFASWIFNSGIEYQFTQRQFSPVNRFRPQEYERDYGISNTDSIDIQDISALIGIRKKGIALQYRPGLIASDSIQLFSQMGSFTQVSAKHELNLSFNRIFAIQSTNQFTQKYIWEEKSYLLPFLGLKTLGKYEWLKDPFNTLRNVEQKEWGFAFINPKEVKINYEVGYMHFDNKKLHMNDSYYSTYADEYYLKGFKQWSEGFISSVTATQREVFYAQFDSSTSFFIAQINQSYAFIKEGISGNLFFESGIGSEPKRNVSFVEVDIGKGFYTWIDFNENGIKELNEFVVANYLDQAKFVKIITPSNEFVPSELQKINFTNTIRPSQWFSTSKAFASRFENDFNFTLMVKQFNVRGLINPLKISYIDTSLLALQQGFVNTIYFNRYHEHINIDYTLNQLDNNSLLTNGIDRKSLNSNVYHLRLLFWSQIWVLEQYVEEGNDRLTSAFGTGNGYNIRFFKYKNEVIYTQSSILRLSLNAAYVNKENLIKESPNALKALEVGIESRYSKLNSLTFLSGLKVVNNNFKGAVQSNAAYAMLDGLQNGINWLWNANIQKNLPNKIQLTVAYQGRSSNQNKTIHIGSIQARAFF